MLRKSIRKNLRKFRSKRRVLKFKSLRTRKSIKYKRLHRRKHGGGSSMEDKLNQL